MAEISVVEVLTTGGIQVVEVTDSTGETTTVEIDSGITVVEIGFPGLQGAAGPGSSGSSDFLGLTDTPNSYVGQASKVVQVNVAENALEFGVVLSTTFQPLDSDLTAIAALVTTTFGRSLLTLADEDALEALPDTLPNLTSIQGRTITLADAGANAFFGWDDVAGAYENLTAAEAEAIIEPLIDTLANLTSIQGLTVTFADAGLDVVSGWDDSASAHKNFALADILTEGSPATGDFVLIYGAEGDLRKANWSSLPGAGGGQTPWLQDIDAANFDLTDVTQLVLGDTAALATFDGSTPSLQVLGTNASTSAIASARFSNDTFEARWRLAKSRGAAAGSYTAVQVNDALAEVSWMGADGTQFKTAAALRANVDNTVATNQVPGRLTVITANTSGTVTDRWFWGSTGHYVPAVDATYDIGTTTVGINDIHFGLGGIINFDGGDVTITHGANAITVAGGDLFVPDEVYDATGWNGNLSVPTKNAIRDKIESLASGFTQPQAIDEGVLFTWSDSPAEALVTFDSDRFYFGVDIAVPDEAYSATTWNGSLEVPTKNAIRDKIETLGSQTPWTSDIDAANFDLTDVTQLVVGDTAALATFDGATPSLQVLGLTASTASGATARFSNDAFEPRLRLAKSRGVTVGSYTAVQANDALGEMVWMGADGTQFEPAASIRGNAEGTIATGQVPGRLTIITSNTSGVATDRWAWGSAGHYEPALDATYDIGTSTIGINDLHLGLGGVINFDGGDVTVTHALNTLTIAGGILAVPNLSTVNALPLNLTDAGLDVLVGWDDSATQVKNFALADILTEATPATGDFVLIYGAEGDLRKANWSTLPGGGFSQPESVTDGVLFTAADNADEAILAVASVASAVNYFTVTNAATGGYPAFTATGSDADIGVSFVGKGEFSVRFLAPDLVGPDVEFEFEVDHIAFTGSDGVVTVGFDATSGFAAIFADGGPLSVRTFTADDITFATNDVASLVLVGSVASAVNYLTISNAATTAGPLVAAVGSDTNVDLRLSGQGTGVLRFGTHTGNADAPITGYVTIKDSGGTIRKLAVIA